MKTILIADDDRLIVETLNAILTEAGYNIITAYDGEEALSKIIKHTPGLVILDINMPKMNGYDVITEIKNRVVPMPKTIILTVRDTMPEQALGTIIGADLYLTKPFKNAELRDKVQQLLPND
ncbi:MAG: response regulator [Elusimicrobiota bacterium]